MREIIYLNLNLNILFKMILFFSSKYYFMREKGVTMQNLSHVSSILISTGNVEKKEFEGSISKDKDSDYKKYG